MILWHILRLENEEKISYLFLRFSQNINISIELQLKLKIYRLRKLVNFCKKIYDMDYLTSIYKISLKL